MTGESSPGTGASAAASASAAAESTSAAAAASASAAAPKVKTGIPKNPGRRELGMKATLLFPDRDIVDRFYVPLIYTACRPCSPEQLPQDIFAKAAAGQIDAQKMQKLISGVIESGHGSTI